MQESANARPLAIVRTYALHGPLVGYILFWGFMGGLPGLELGFASALLGWPLMVGLLMGGAPALVTGIAAAILTRFLTKTWTYVAATIAVGVGSSALTAVLLPRHSPLELLSLLSFMATGAGATLVCVLATLPISGRMTRWREEQPFWLKRLRAGDVLLVIILVACAILAATLLRPTN